MKIRVAAAPAKSIPCPTCKATGKQTIETRSRSAGKVEISSFEMTCTICNGAKEISPRLQKALKREADLWCSCKTPSLENSIFCDDGECGDCDKHHYHCGTCKKICQVG